MFCISFSESVFRPDLTAILPLRSPLIGTLVLDDPSFVEKVDNFHARSEDCGVEFYDLLNLKSGVEVSLPVFCDNRACDKPKCKKHRLYQYIREHGSQVEILDKSMRKPKGWIFTDTVFDGVEFVDKKYAQDRLSLLYKLLRDPKHGSVTEFSIHMEFKIRLDGSVYLHFHAVFGAVKDLRFVRAKWKRVVRFETAINSKDLGWYVSKYASKCPLFNSVEEQSCYHVLVYKLQMHRFSVHLGSPECVVSDWVNLTLLRSEIKDCLMMDSYLNPNSSERYYHEFLERLPPPNVNKDLFEVEVYTGGVESKVVDNFDVCDPESLKWCNPEKVRISRCVNRALDDFMEL